MFITTITPATDLPVSLDEAKAHLRIFNSTVEDTLIEGLIWAATGHIEGANGRGGVVRRTLVTATLEARMDGFPRSGRLELPRPPLLDVVTIEYRAPDTGNWTLVPAGDYETDAALLIGRVRPAFGKSWPATARVDLSVRVTYRAGYGAPAAVPEPFKQAIKLLVGHWYRNREAVGEATTANALAVDALLAAFVPDPVA